MESNSSLLSGDIFDECVVLDVDELSRLCAVERRVIVELAEEGVLGRVETTTWRFTGASLRRARTALRLQRDLEINLPGVALAMELMEQLDRLRAELQRREEPWHPLEPGHAQ